VTLINAIRELTRRKAFIDQRLEAGYYIGGTVNRVRAESEALRKALQALNEKRDDLLALAKLKGSEAPLDD
jgi:Arc/MetJ-type ribon-helix-helix transcriptional regulator